MPQPDLTWLKGTANELNNLLQVIAESSRVIEGLCKTDDEARRYYNFLCASLDRAISVTTEMSARLGGQVQASENKPMPEPVREKIPATIHVSNPDGPHELVMIVDDEEMVRRIATAVLTRAGYRVVSVADSFRAIEVFGKLRDSIDLVVLDFGLPIMDGAEVFEEFRKLRADVAVVLSSGFAEQSKISKMLAKGLRGFLPKPYTEQRMLEQIRSTLDAVRTARTGERRVL